MSETTSVKQGVAAGTSIGAAIIMVTVGIIQFCQGIAAVAENEVFVSGVNYVYKFDLTTWGWIHIVLGVLVAAVGLALLTGAGWARVSAIVIAQSPYSPTSCGCRTTRGGRCSSSRSTSW